MLRAIALTCLLVLGASPAALSAQDRITVYAAASLTEALQEAALAYSIMSGSDLRFSFASSSTLARQIDLGAPADIFASANDVWMDYLEKRQLIASDSRREVLSNRLTLISPRGSALAAPDFADRTALLEMLGPSGWLAVGDPAHVPAGIYAKQALEALGWWAALEPRLARADNTRAALALVERGEAPLGIVYATDAAASDGVLTLALLPEDLHAPILYPFGIVTGRDSPAVRAAFAYLTGEEALAIYRRHGFQAGTR